MAINDLLVLWLQLGFTTERPWQETRGQVTATAPPTSLGPIGVVAAWPVPAPVTVMANPLWPFYAHTFAPEPPSERPIVN